jgi:hypothetical protein
MVMTHTWVFEPSTITQDGLIIYFHVPPINMKVATIKGGETTLIKDYLDRSFYLTNQEFFLN